MVTSRDTADVTVTSDVSISVAIPVVSAVEPPLSLSRSVFLSGTYLTVKETGRCVVTGVACVVARVLVRVLARVLARVLVRVLVRVLECVRSLVTLTPTETDSASARNSLEFVSKPPLFFSWATIVAWTTAGVLLVANLSALCTTTDPRLLGKTSVELEYAAATHAL